MNLFSSNVSAIIGSAYKNFLKKMKLNRFMNNIIISINVFNIDSICTDTDRVFNCLYLYVCHPVCPSMCLPSCVSVYVSAILCVRLCVCHTHHVFYLSIFIYLFLQISIHLNIIFMHLLFIYISINPSIFYIHIYLCNYLYIYICVTT